MTEESPRAFALGTWRDVVGADARALAAFRVLLAGSVLLDLAIRASDLRAFYTDAGILPRAAALEHFAWLHELAPSLHLLGGSTWSQVLLFSLHALAAASMLVGYRTRGATFVVWLLLTSLQLRNLYVGAGVDALLRMLLFWGIFLPLGAHWSVDEHQSEPDAPQRSPALSFATVALVAQVAFVYGGAGLAKLEVPAWTSGQALELILQDDMRTTALGIWVGDQPGLCALLDRLVLLVELTGPALLLVPFAFGVVRTATVGLFIAINVGFLLTLEVGLFPWVAIVAVVPLLPRWFCDASSRRLRATRLRGWTTATHHLLEGLATRLPARPAASPTVARVSRVSREALCAGFLLFVATFNAGVILDPQYRPPASIEWVGRSLFLQQAWKMFARPASRTGWIAVEGRLRDGRAVDLLTDGGPVPDLAEAQAATASAAPPLVSSQYANDRWRGFLSKAVRTEGDVPQFLLYGRYVCRDWNSAHSGADQLKTFTLVWHVKEIPGPPDAAPDRTETLWRHDCFG